VGNVKYVTLSPAQRAWWDDLYHLDPRSTGIDRVEVLETSYDPQPTGLLDVHGNELFRVTEKRPIGFRVLNEY
jgi:hypothetical protein